MLYIPLISAESKDVHRNMSLHPVHLVPDQEGQLPPSALIPFCSYQTESDLLGQERPEENMTVCDKFEPTVFNGQPCYSLNISKLDKQPTRKGKAGGLFLLVDSNPGHDPDAPNSFAMYIHTLEQYVGSEAYEVLEGGVYKMKNLKRMAAAESFELLSDSQKECQVHNLVECQTKRFLDKVKSNCSCIPWGLMRNNTDYGACGPEKERCVAEQPLRDESCLVPCSGLYAEISEESFMQQLRKERNASTVQEDNKNVKLLTEKYTRYKQQYVRQLRFDPMAQNLSKFTLVSFTYQTYLFSPRS